MRRPARVLATGALAFLAILSSAGIGFAAGSVVSQRDVILRADLARDLRGDRGRHPGRRDLGRHRGLDEAKASGDLPPGTCGLQSGGVTAIDPSRCPVGVVTAGREGTAMTMSCRTPTFAP